MQALQARIDSFHRTRRVRRHPARPAAAAAALRWPHPPAFRANPSTLAEAGFFFDPSWDDRDSVACFLCGKELSDWDADDDPFQIHYAKCQNSCAWAVVRCGLADDLDDDGRFVFANKHRLPSAKAMEKARLETFGSDWWPHDGQPGHAATSVKMAQAGFVYTPQAAGDDTVTCLYCNLSLGGWEKEDDPAHEHRTRDSKSGTACPFLALSSKPTRSKSAKKPPVEHQSDDDLVEAPVAEPPPPRAKRGRARSTTSTTRRKTRGTRGRGAKASAPPRSPSPAPPEMTDPEPDPSPEPEPPRKRGTKASARPPSPDPESDPSPEPKPPRKRGTKAAARSPSPDPEPDPSPEPKPSRKRGTKAAARSPSPDPEPEPEPPRKRGTKAFARSPSPEIADPEPDPTPEPEPPRKRGTKASAPAPPRSPSPDPEPDPPLSPLLVNGSICPLPESPPKADTPPPVDALKHPDPIVTLSPTGQPTIAPSRSLTQDERAMSLEQWIRHEIDLSHEKLMTDGQNQIDLFKTRAAELRKCIDEL